MGYISAALTRPHAVGMAEVLLSQDTMIISKRFSFKRSPNHPTKGAIILKNSVQSVCRGEAGVNESFAKMFPLEERPTHPLERKAIPWAVLNLRWSGKAFELVC